MNADWRSYSFADFVPVTADVYFRLIERINESFWPLHLPVLIAGGAATALALHGRPRTACLLLAAAWLLAGTVFHLQYYANLNWAATYFGSAFLAQAALLAILAAGGRGTAPSRSRTLPRLAGLVVALFGLAVYPAIAPLTGQELARAEIFGLHPDPTAVTTLGVLLVALRGGWLWLSAIVPALWCLLTALSLHVLNAPWAAAPAVAAVLCMIAALGKATPSSHSDGSATRT